LCNFHRYIYYNLKFTHLAIGKNQPLKKEIPKWKSDVPLTEGQLRSKRDEFWDTAPAYGGKSLDIFSYAVLQFYEFNQSCYQMLSAVLLSQSTVSS